MVQLPIKRTIERIPGGMMIVPLFTGAIIRTLFPKTPGFFGSFTGALFTGALTILAVFYVCMGSTIEFKATPFILKRAGRCSPQRSRQRSSSASCWAGSGAKLRCKAASWRDSPLSPSLPP